MKAEMSGPRWPGGACKEKTMTMRFTLSLLAAGLALAASAAPVIYPGSPQGPMRFVDADGALAVSCVGPANGCVVVGGAGAARLQAGAATLIPIGFAHNRTVGTASRHNDFTVAASPDGQPTTVPVRVSADLHVKGGLAALMEGRATVDVRLVLLDVTDASQPPTPVASRSLFDDEVSGSFQPSVGVSPGVLLPVPDGDLSLEVGVGIEGRKKLIDEDVAGDIEALVQRGHSYRIVIELQTQSDIGVGGGLGFSTFVDGSGIFDRMPNFVDPTMWVSQLEPILKVPDLHFDAAVFNASLTIPGVGPVQVFPGYQQSLSVPGFSHSFETFPGFDWSTDAGGVLPHSIGFEIPSETVSLSIPGVTLPSIDIPPVSVELPQQDIDLPLAGPFSDLSGMLSDIGLPDFAHDGVDFGTIASWLQGALPQDEIVITDGGVSVNEISVVLGNDVRADVLSSRDALMVHEDAASVAIQGSVAAARAAVIDNADANNANVQASIFAARGAIVANALANRSDMLAAIAGARSAVISNADAHHDAAIRNDDANRDQIIARDDENTQAILDAVAALQEDGQQREIESLLGSGRCEPWMYAPSIPASNGGDPSGGQLELTLEVLQRVIEDAAALGSAAPRDVEDARADLADALSIAAQPLPWGPHAAQDLCHLLTHAWGKVTVPGSN
jgi:hypothetical protein